MGSREAATLPASERCPSGLRSATGNRVRAERCVEGSNPSLSVRLAGERPFSREPLSPRRRHSGRAMTLSPDALFFLRLWTAAHRGERLAARELDADGLGGPQLAMLLLVALHEPATTTVLAAALGVPFMTASDALQRLVGDGRGRADGESRRPALARVPSDRGRTVARRRGRRAAAPRCGGCSGRRARRCGRAARRVARARAGRVDITFS